MLKALYDTRHDIPLCTGAHRRTCGLVWVREPEPRSWFSVSMYLVPGGTSPRLSITNPNPNPIYRTCDLLSHPPPQANMDLMDGGGEAQMAPHTMPASYPHDRTRLLVSLLFVDFWALGERQRGRSDDPSPWAWVGRAGPAPCFVCIDYRQTTYTIPLRLSAVLFGCADLTLLGCADNTS